MTTTTAANLDRAFCKSCRISFRLPEGTRIDWMQVVPRIASLVDGSLIKHECGNYLRGQRVEARTGKQECGDKCTSAIGPACECKCSGENHGIGR